MEELELITSDQDSDEKKGKRGKGQKVFRQETYLSPEEEVATLPISTSIISVESARDFAKDDYHPPETNNGVLQTILSELRQNPNLAVELVHFLAKVTKSWEPISIDGTPINEVPVPPGQSPKDFMKTTTSPTHINGFRLTTIFGDEVAKIIKGSPKWRVIVEGDYQIDTPFVNHGQKAEAETKEFAESKLKQRGYIIG